MEVLFDFVKLESVISYIIFGLFELLGAGISFSFHKAMAMVTEGKQVSNAHALDNLTSSVIWTHTRKPTAEYMAFTFHVWSVAYLFKCYLNGPILIQILIYWCALKSKTPNSKRKKLLRSYLCLKVSNHTNTVRLNGSNHGFR